jgi:excisionase family DNA binding protein
MTTSPALRVSALDRPVDVFEQLAASERLLTAKELARILAISPKTVYGYVERNAIPHFKIQANVRFRPRDIAEWLQRCGCRPLP